LTQLNVIEWFYPTLLFGGKENRLNGLSSPQGAMGEVWVKASAVGDLDLFGI
jgi:hypothetical protein